MKLKVGQQVVISKEAQTQGIRDVGLMTVRGFRHDDPDVVRVERISRKGTPYSDYCHKDFLQLAKILTEKTRLVKFRCVCGRTTTRKAKQHQDGRWFRPAYCERCERKTPGLKLFVEKVSRSTEKTKREVK